MRELAQGVAVKLAWFFAGVVVVVLAWQGNLGKGLACMIAPGVLEVPGNDQTTQTGQDFNQAAAASPAAGSTATGTLRLKP